MPLLAVTLLAVSLTGWTELSAIGTFVLAAATVGAVMVTVRMAQADRERDDRRRREDQDRADQQRREDAAEWQQRFASEQRERQDYEAHQVAIELEPGFIVVVAPVGYPVKQVDVRITHQASSGLGIEYGGYEHDEPQARQGGVRYQFPYRMPPPAMRHPEAIARFTDQHGNLYYLFRNHAMRFPGGTSWEQAAATIDLWTRTGPGAAPPDELQPLGKPGDGHNAAATRQQDERDKTT